MHVVLFCIFAGIGGTCLGCLWLFTRETMSSDAIQRILTFGAGFMAGLVCFELIPEAFELTGPGMTIAGLAAGLGFILLIDAITHKLNAHSHHDHGDSGPLHTLPANEKTFIHAGRMMLISISLHNLPEGIAIGSGGSYDIQLGITLAAVIALHNLPVGMAIAAPLLAGNYSKGRVLFLTALSGVPTLAGGFIGMTAGSVSDAMLAFSLAGAGGTMLYVVCREILPQSIRSIPLRIALPLFLTGGILGMVLTRFA
ncbi:MAG: ZIP family metal transporter [Clostridiales bacterium]|nr:ZIP family metal transporter [Clostridiales bacterium]